MGNRKRMKDGYRHVSFLSDIEGMKNAIGEMRGMFFPKQPPLNPDARPGISHRVPDEAWGGAGVVSLVRPGKVV